MTKRGNGGELWPRAWAEIASIASGDMPFPDTKPMTRRDAMYLLELSTCCDPADADNILCLAREVMRRAMWNEQDRVETRGRPKRRE